MKKLHYSLFLCFVFLCLNVVNAQVSVTWSASSTVNVSGTTFTSVGSPASIVGTNGIDGNRDGWITFKLNAAVGNCQVAFGLGDANNASQNYGNTFLMSVFNGGVLDCYKQAWTYAYHEWANGNDNANNELKIERIGTVMNYYLNGQLKYTTSTLAGIKLVPVILFSEWQNGKSVNVTTQISGPGIGTSTPVVQFDYDDAGNRYRRKQVIVVLPRSAAKPETTDAIAAAIKLKIFPNPSDGHFEVTIENADKDLSLSMFDASGRQVHTQPVAGLNTSVDVSQLPTGLYIMTLQDAQKRRGQWKVVIQ